MKVKEQNQVCEQMFMKWSPNDLVSGPKEDFSFRSNNCLGQTGPHCGAGCQLLEGVDIGMRCCWYTVLFTLLIHLCCVD